jgi:hypothetical protein
VPVAAVSAIENHVAKDARRAQVGIAGASIGGHGRHGELTRCARAMWRRACRQRPAVSIVAVEQPLGGDAIDGSRQLRRGQRVGLNATLGCRAMRSMRGESVSTAVQAVMDDARPCRSPPTDEAVSQIEQIAVR